MCSSTFTANISSIVSAESVCVCLRFGSYNCLKLYYIERISHTHRDKERERVQQSLSSKRLQRSDIASPLLSLIKQPKYIDIDTHTCIFMILCTARISLTLILRCLCHYKRNYEHRTRNIVK